MATPCEWATCAVSKQGRTFKLTKVGGSSTEAKLVHVSTMSSGGYNFYSFSFIGPAGGPSGDGMYSISGGGCPDMETFFVAQVMPDGEGSYVASISCKA